MDEETDVCEPLQPSQKPSPILVCKCLLNDPGDSGNFEITGRKLQVLTTVSRTENYLRERRIPELIRYLLTKLLADVPEDPAEYLEKLFDDCMVFRAGHGIPPVIYEERHLKAVVKSFDPGNRGWMSAGQVRRAMTTLGLSKFDKLQDQMSTDDVLKLLTQTQEDDLYKLLTSGREEEDSDNSKSSKETTVSSTLS